MKKSKTTLVSSIVASSLLISSVAPIVSNAETINPSTVNSANEITNEDINELKKLENELKATNITADDFSNGLNEEVKNNTTPVLHTSGIKSQAAKVAAKSMIKNVQRIGQIAWDRSVSQYVNKLPFSSTAKKTLKKYLKYKVVMDVLNTVIDFSGTITNGLEEQLKKMGMSSFLAGFTARVIVGLLL